jgi:hypothetical protein
MALKKLKNKNKSKAKDGSSTPEGSADTSGLTNKDTEPLL